MKTKVEGKSELESIKVPDKASVKMQQLLSAKLATEAQFSTYTQGCFDALGLEGDWDLDTDTWTFNRKVHAEEVSDA
ncbi:hypothetical protein LCGC14_0607480 [marine sediment metagenome]|uniref:Uncharacterized protein n=1 Tax=marine sediment metagenome TaxID=412755 RepID=A0A0F9RSV0_9ZZZZ